MARAPRRACPLGAASAGASGSAHADRRSSRSRRTLPHGALSGQAELALRGTLDETHQLMATEEELLLRFMPKVCYDSLEAYFADHPLQMLVNPGNRLRRGPAG